MTDTTPDWVQASPRRIESMLEQVLARPFGGWFVLDVTSPPTTRPRRYVVDGCELVLWHDGRRWIASPAACPHMGADLSTGHVCQGRLVCPWHGLALSADGQGRWQPSPVHDDGQLLWVRLPAPHVTDSPILAPRPALAVRTGYRFELDCDPQDVIANRLDPWHGAHLHPHSFSALSVEQDDDAQLRLAVEVKLMGSLRVQANVTFHCPTANSIVMTIIDGPGAGSVLETHVTPITPGRTAVVETMAATSPHRLFTPVRALPGLRGLMRHRLIARAKRLWVEDAEYAERRYQLRMQKRPVGLSRRAPIMVALEDPVVSRHEPTASSADR